METTNTKPAAPKIVTFRVREARRGQYVATVYDGAKVLYRTIPASGNGLAADRADGWATARGFRAVERF